MASHHTTKMTALRNNHPRTHPSQSYPLLAATPSHSNPPSNSNSDVLNSASYQALPALSNTPNTNMNGTNGINVNIKTQVQFHTLSRAEQRKQRLLEAEQEMALEEAEAFKMTEVRFVSFLFPCLNASCPRLLSFSYPLISAHFFSPFLFRFSSLHFRISKIRTYPY